MRWNKWSKWVLVALSLAMSGINMGQLLSVFGQSGGRALVEPGLATLFWLVLATFSLRYIRTEKKDKDDTSQDK